MNDDDSILIKNEQSNKLNSAVLSFFGSHQPPQRRKAVAEVNPLKCLALMAPLCISLNSRSDLIWVNNLWQDPRTYERVYLPIPSNI